MRSTSSGVVVLVVVLVAAIVVAACLFVDFRVAHSQTESGHRIAKYTMNDPQVVYPLPTLDLYIVHNGMLDRAVAKALQQELQPMFKDISVVDERPADFDKQPALWIEVKERRVLWTPVFGQGQVAVDVYYASDGDLSWVGDDTVVMSSAEHPNPIWLSGELEVSDRTFGIISCRGYHSHLGQQIAARLAEYFSSLMTS